MLPPVVQVPISADLLGPPWPLFSRATALRGTHCRGDPHPTAAHWLRELGEVDRIQAETGLQVRDQPRTPNESRPHPKIDIYVAAPFTANSIAKLALGLADNQALTVLCENIAITSMIVFPRINAAHARQPSWLEHIRRLESAGVELIYGDHVWQLAEPRMADSRKLPWPAILAAIKRHC